MTSATKTAKRPAAKKAPAKKAAAKKAAPVRKTVAKKTVAKKAVAKKVVAKKAAPAPAPAPVKTAPAARPLVAKVRAKRNVVLPFRERLEEAMHRELNHQGPVCHRCRMNGSRLAALAAS